MTSGPGTRWRTCALLALLAALAATNGPGASAATRAVDTCKLITAAEAGRVLGSRMTVVRGEGLASCNLLYRAGGRRHLIVSAYPDSPGKAYGFQGLLRTSRATRPGGPLLRHAFRAFRVSGDPAFRVEQVVDFGSGTEHSRAIWVLHHAYVFRLRSGRPGQPPATFARPESLTRIALKRF